MYIRRDIEKKLYAVAKEYPIVLITGPRQVGKTTVLKETIAAGYNFVTLDDMEERNLAQKDPSLFLQLHQAPVMIDEVQYAPGLFPYLKIQADNGAGPGSYLLTETPPGKPTPSGVG